MDVILNGEPATVPSPLTIADVSNARGGNPYAPKPVAVTVVST